MIFLNKTKVFRYKNNLIFVDEGGAISLDISNYLHQCNIVIKLNDISIKPIDATNPYFIKVKNTLVEEIKQILFVLNNPIKKKLLLFGVGFRSWVYKTKDNLSFMLLKIGFSRDMCVKIPLDVKVICLKPTLILIKGFDKVKVNQFVASIRLLKTPDPYKGKGIQFINEKLIFKPGKQN